MTNIQSKAVLVKLSIGMPGNSRKDPSLTDEVQKDHNLTKESGRWLKKLYPDEALKPISELVRKAREHHYIHSLPWKDEGWRILPTAMHFDYTEQMRCHRGEFETLTETHFLSRYDDWVVWAMKAHNGTFERKDYPGVEKIREKFSFEVEFQALPSGNDFRVDLNADEIEAMQQQVNQRVASAVDEARSDLWRRLMDPVRCMVERLSQPDVKFRDSLVGNLKEIVGLVPALNLTGDQKLDDFRIEIQNELCKWNPDTLRENQNARSEAAKQADAILKRMEGYFTP